MPPQTRAPDGGFGNSEKRSRTDRLKYGRPMIGRLGIGMLGIAQICGSFVIRSRPLQGTGFVAHVRLSDRLRARLDSNDSDVIEEIAHNARPPRGARLGWHCSCALRRKDRLFCSSKGGTA
jgi:hypothetical protein